MYNLKLYPSIQFTIDLADLQKMLYEYKMVPQYLSKKKSLWKY